MPPKRPPFDPTEALRNAFRSYPGGYQRALEDIAKAQRLHDDMMRTLGGSVQHEFQDRLSRIASLGVPSGLAGPALNAIVAANTSLSSLTAPGVLERLSKEWATAQRPWLDSLGVASKLTSGPDAAMLASIAHVSKLAGVSAAAEALFRGVEWERFATAPVLPIGAGVRLQDDFLALTEAYAALSAHLDVHIAALPPILSALPPVEMYAGVHLVRSVSPSESGEPESEEVAEAVALCAELELDTSPALEAGLSGIKPALLGLWHGARAALSSGNPDRARHVASSLRELCTTVLHELAPDDAVRSWTTDSKHYDKGRPTRRARLLFICRTINDGPFTQFVEQDVRAALAFVDVFQSGTHKIESDLSEAQGMSRRLLN